MSFFKLEEALNDNRHSSATVWELFTPGGHAVLHDVFSFVGVALEHGKKSEESGPGRLCRIRQADGPGRGRQADIRLCL